MTGRIGHIGRDYTGSVAASSSAEIQVARAEISLKEHRLRNKLRIL